ncbi:MAG: FixH family protein [Pseudomonadota bacterium]
MASRPKKSFTGRHMTAVLVVGFGIVAAVNFTMASYAAGGFHGVVVENSYVASQKYNEWLAQAEAAKALGWGAEVTRDEAGHVVVATTGVPAGADVTAELRRPIGDRDYVNLRFEPQEDGLFRSTTKVKDGRWTTRLYIESAGQKWAEESEL